MSSYFLFLRLGSPEIIPKYLVLCRLSSLLKASIKNQTVGWLQDRLPWKAVCHPSTALFVRGRSASIIFVVQCGTQPSLTFFFHITPICNCRFSWFILSVNKSIISYFGFVSAGKYSIHDGLPSNVTKNWINDSKFLRKTSRGIQVANY